MSDLDGLTNKAAYESVGNDRQISGAIGPRDWDRFRQTLKHIPEDTDSLLDAGCDRGHWLSYALERRDIRTHLGIDISEGRIAEAKVRYAHLNLQAGYLESLSIAPDSFDVVTSLEVLEHIPDWLAVLKLLLRAARRRVVISVPYKENIQQTVCIHCGNLTPFYGHLRSFDEGTFPQEPDWRLHFGFVLDYGIGATLARRIYRMVCPRRAWLIAIYDAHKN